MTLETNFLSLDTQSLETVSNRNSQFGRYALVQHW